MRKLRRILETRKGEIAAQSRTEKLWIRYMDYMDVIKLFIRGERSGNWDDHLLATAKMLSPNKFAPIRISSIYAFSQ